MDVEPTAEVIDAMSKRMREVAKDLERTAAQMRERKDLTYAAEAINSVSNLMNQLRLDLLVTRPIREFAKEVQ